MERNPINRSLTMLERLKSTVRDTFIYSLSNIAPKVIGVILLPLYTKELTLNDFGNWDLIDNVILILTHIVILGQASSIIFLNNNREYKSEKKTTLFTLTVFILVISLLLVAASEIFIFKYSSFFEKAQMKGEYLRLASYIILFKVLNNLFFAKIRAEEESVFYSSVSIAGTFLLALLTVYFVAYLNQNITGILRASLIVEILITVVLLFKIIPQVKLRFSFSILSTALKFGIPLVFSAVGFLLLNQSDRFIIKYLLGSKYVALYGLGYRVAGVLSMFLITPFSLGLLPIAYKYYGMPDDKRFYSKLMTYSSFFFVWGFVFLSLFSKEIISILAEKPEYESAFFVVPIVLLSYVFSGMRLTAQLGMLLTKNTKHVAWTTLGAAILNITLNFIFIPVYGILAAAINTLVAFVIFHFITQAISGKYYKIPYENFKLFLLIVIGTILASIIYFLPSINPIFEISFKLLITAVFPFLLLPFKFYEKAELEILTSPSKMLDFVKGIFKGAKETPVDAGTNIEQ